MDQQKKTFVVTLKGLAPWISEMHYEKEERDLKLFFSLNKEAEVNIIVEDGEDRVKKLIPLATPLAPLSKKLISNVEYKPNSDLYITCVTQGDFALCGAAPLALKGAVEELRACGAEDSSLLVLFETKRGGSQGLLWSKRQEMRNRVRALNKGTEKGNWLLFAANEPVGSLRETLKEKL